MARGALTPPATRRILPQGPATGFPWAEEALEGLSFLWKLPAFLRRRLTPERAGAILQRRHAERGGDFLALARTAIYGSSASPYQLGPTDLTAVAETFLAAIGAGAGAERIMGQVWRDGQLLRVERRAPLATASGKILHLHVNPTRQPQNRLQQGAGHPANIDRGRIGSIAWSANDPSIGGVMETLLP